MHTLSRASTSHTCLPNLSAFCDERSNVKNAARSLGGTWSRKLMGGLAHPGRVTTTRSVERQGLRRRGRCQTARSHAAAGCSGVPARAVHGCCWPVYRRRWPRPREKRSPTTQHRPVLQSWRPPPRPVYASVVTAHHGPAVQRPAETSRADGRHRAARPRATPPHWHSELQREPAAVRRSRFAPTHAFPPRALQRSAAACSHCRVHRSASDSSDDDV